MTGLKSIQQDLNTLSLNEATVIAESSTQWGGDRCLRLLLCTLSGVSQNEEEAKAAFEAKCAMAPAIFQQCVLKGIVFQSNAVCTPRVCVTVLPCFGSVLCIAYILSTVFSNVASFRTTVSVDTALLILPFLACCSVVAEVHCYG